MTPASAPSRTSAPPRATDSLDWLEVAIDAPEPAHETAVAALHASGSTGAWIVGAREVRGYYPVTVRDPARAFAEAWRDLGGGAPPAVAVRRVPFEDWTEGWRRSVKPIAVTPGLWVAPPDAPPPSGGWPVGALVLRVLPGLGFGTGAHPTTRALLAWLAADPVFDDALDVGTGSGVLAIAAARLGARRVIGLDVDPLALGNAAGNLRANAVEDRVHLVRGSVDAIDGSARFDRVLANLDRSTLERLLPEIAKRCAPHGRVGLAGLLAHERDPIVERARAAGLSLVDEEVAADQAAGDEWWSGWLAPEGG